MNGDADKTAKPANAADPPRPQQLSFTDTLLETGVYTLTYIIECSHCGKTIDIGKSYKFVDQTQSITHCWCSRDCAQTQVSPDLFINELVSIQH